MLRVVVSRDGGPTSANKQSQLALAARARPFGACRSLGASLRSTPRWNGTPETLNVKRYRCSGRIDIAVA